MSNATNTVVFDARALRQASGLNQTEFWTPLGVTQSGGSRYENDRRIPKPVVQLIRLRYVLGVNIERIDERNAGMISELTSGLCDSRGLGMKISAANRLIKLCNKIVESAEDVKSVACDLSRK